MTPTSAPDLPDIDKVLQMTKDMELISDFLTNGRFVGDRVYVSIEHLAECIRNTRPQSEASALATPVPVGWRPIETAPYDGRMVDLYSPEYGRVTDCFFNRPDGQWYRDGDIINEKVITHWMPLPAPPHTDGR